ncbi:MAG TPA: serine/threonine-protein kinase [Gemmataceae bacterium]|jgi:serine/threonine protein kinase
MGLDTVKSVGNYDLLEKIAEGGMGAIYRGRHRDSGAIVAIKIMAPHLTKNPLLLKRFEQEFRAASRLDHPNIVRALDYSDNDNRPYLVMEFVEGESLGQKLERDGRMSETEALRLIAQVAQALHRAHKQNLVHRDVKPDNILVTNDGVAKLADLGLVKETETDLNLTRTGRGLGTPHFMAPEQFRNAKNADIRCDIYSLGATLYQMVTGELPFRSNGPLDAWMKKIQNDLLPPRQLVPELSERLDWAIRRAMSADPEKRPGSCREFVEDLTGKSTRRLPSVDSSVSQQDLWYLVYKDETGAPHTVKGTVSAIRRSLRDGLLGDASNVRASRSKAGPFEALCGYAEFRDMVVDVAPLSVPQSPSSRPGAAAADDTAETLTACQPIKQGQPQESSAATTATVTPNKPLITLKDVPPSTNTDALKWVVFFVLLFLTAIVSFWFFQK